MSTRNRISLAGIILSVFFCAGVSLAGEQKLGQVFNESARLVHSVPVPELKRAILDREFQAVDSALTSVAHMPLVSPADREAIGKYKAIVQDKRDELNGANGFERVSNAQLDAFAHYAVQDVEQADTIVTMSFVTLLLIVLLIVLIVR